MSTSAWTSGGRANPSAKRIWSALVFLPARAVSTTRMLTKAASFRRLHALRVARLMPLASKVPKIGDLAYPRPSVLVIYPCRYVTGWGLHTFSRPEEGW